MSSTPENATVRDANLLNAARLVLGAIAKGDDMSDELTGAMQQLALAGEEAPERFRLVKVKGTAGPYALPFLFVDEAREAVCILKRDLETDEKKLWKITLSPSDVRNQFTTDIFKRSRTLLSKDIKRIDVEALVKLIKLSGGSEEWGQRVGELANVYLPSVKSVTKSEMMLACSTLSTMSFPIYSLLSDRHGTGSIRM
jgi:hypothetical protein